MTYSKTIVCLANSRKTAGRCVAGIEIDGRRKFGKWIRPVSARDTQEVSEDERRYENGADPQLLDIVKVPFQKKVPHVHQTENHLIDDRYYWEKTGIITWDELRNAAQEEGDSLWGTGDSSYYGTNDRIPQKVAETYTSSLMLIKPKGLTVLVRVEGQEFGNPKRRIRAGFEWEGETYVLSVTDPVVERRFLQMDNGEYPIADAVLCISLGEAFSDGKCYKFCAAIITRRSAATT